MYKLYLSDGSIFADSAPLHSKWNQAPVLPVEKMIYIFGNNRIELSGFEAYNHLVERTFRFMGTRSVERPTAIRLCVKAGTKTICLKCNTETQIVTREEFEYGTEDNGNPVLGWKAGVIKTPEIKITKLI